MTLARQRRTAPSIPRILGAALLGISANTLLLQLAPRFGVRPGSGGLLRLILSYAKHWAPWALPWMRRLGLSRPPSFAGALWFHYATGVGMLLAYFLLLAPRMTGSRWTNATLFALFVWLLNAAVILPLLGQGFAGLHKISAVGAAYFFLANWAFVLVAEWASCLFPTQRQG